MPDTLLDERQQEAAVELEHVVTADPLRVLFWLWRITGRPEYRDAARRSAEFVLGGQKPDGAWPLTVNSHTLKPGGGYGGYSTLNDGTTVWGMKAMLLGSLPSDGRLIWPAVGPDAEARRSNWRPLITSG